RGKSKKATHPPKLVPSTHSKLELIHMDLCGPMMVECINGKKYILVIVDDYSRYTLVYFLRTKDEAPDTINKFIAQALCNNSQLQERLNKRCGRKTNRTLVEAAQTMLIFPSHQNSFGRTLSRPRMYTQNLHLSHKRYNKTPYELLRGRKPNLKYFHVFGSLCFPTNNREDLGKMKPKSDIGIFIGYSESPRGFWINNRRPRWIMETIHVKFNELTTIASEHNCLEPGTNRFQDNDSSIEDTSIPKKEDLDSLFGPMYKEYFEKRSPKVSINSAALTTLNNQDTPSSSSIIVKDNEAPPLVCYYEEQISLISNDEADELIPEEDSA
ncbi:retrovirus-related pol polyprotein from transposon TNT 1-94, partial [Tanacetum coccineum]